MQPLLWWDNIDSGERLGCALDPTLCPEPYTDTFVIFLLSMCIHHYFIRHNTTDELFVNGTCFRKGIGNHIINSTKCGPRQVVYFDQCILDPIRVQHVYLIYTLHIIYTLHMIISILSDRTMMHSQTIR